jgi:hypothetical protein
MLDATIFSHRKESFDEAMDGEAGGLKTVLCGTIGCHQRSVLWSPSSKPCFYFLLGMRMFFLSIPMM